MTEQRDPAELSQEEATEATPSHDAEPRPVPVAAHGVDAPPSEGDPVERALDEGMPLTEEPEPELDAEPVSEPEPQSPATPEPEPPARPESVATAVVGVPASVATPTVPEEATVSVPTTQAIFRDSPGEAESPESRALSEEEQKLAAERAARRQARVTALAATAPVPVVAAPPVIVHKRTNDKFFGALGLFLLRLVVAGIFAIRGLNIITDIPATQALFATTIIPEPQIMAIATGVGSLLIALSLLLGLLTRLAGVGIIAIAAGALAFVMWGSWNVFVPGQPGFLGELELLLATVGVVFLLLGAGGWSLDRSFRAGRERAKAERAAATPAK